MAVIVRASRDVALAAAVVSATYCLLYASTSAGATMPPPSRVVVQAVAMPAGSPLFPGHSAPVRVTLRNYTDHPFDVDARTIEGILSPLPRGCRASWFTFATGVGSVKVVAGNGGTATVTGRLRFAEANTDQSACARATLSLTLSLR